MANTFSTSTIILKEALAVLTQRPSFISTVNRQYDNKFKGDDLSGAAIGDTVSVRLPQRGIVRRGRVMVQQAIVQQTMPVTLTNYAGMDTGINSLEQTLDIDNFRELVIKPKMADLAAIVESDILALCVPKIPQYAGDWGLLNDRSTILDAGVLLDNNLAPQDGRMILTNAAAGADFVDAQAALFNNQSKIANQYTTGRMGKGVLGFDWDSTTLVPSLVRGTANTAYLTNAATAQTGTSLIVDTGTGTLKIGDIITVAGVNAVHPQTKTDLGYLQQFVVSVDYAGGAGTITLQSPGIVLTGSEQNVTAAAADNSAVSVGGSAGTFQNSIAYCRDAFYAVFADLPNPANMGVDCSVMSYGGISMRYMQGWDIVNDQLLSRFDVLYGGGILRPQLAVRIPNI